MKVSNQLQLELASRNESEEINHLLNLAYRGKKGWTTENSLVDGDRSTVSDVVLAIESSIFLVHKQVNKIVSCVCLKPKGREIYIGSFAVHPDYQNCGLGDSVLNEAEHYALNKLNAKTFIMDVLSERKELIAYYERRGYQCVGDSKEYPLHLNVGIPKKVDLSIIQMCKNV